MFRRWSRSNFIKLFLVVSFFGSQGFAAPKKEKQFPEIKKFESELVRAKTLKANFKQVNQSATFGTESTTTGKILLSLPNQIRWEAENPDKTLTISDGKTVWHYSPPVSKEDKGQLAIGKAKDYRTDFLTHLLSGRLSHLGLEGLNRVQSGAYEIVPKSGKAGSVVKARFALDERTSLLRWIELEHKDGNKSRIELSEVVLGEKFPAGTFRFEKPPGTEIVH